jgi:hypothetical protein
MILEQVSIQNMFHYYANAMSHKPPTRDSAREMAVLFDAPQLVADEAKSEETHRILLAILQGDYAPIEALLDKATLAKAVAAANLKTPATIVVGEVVNLATATASATMPQYAPYVWDGLTSHKITW